MISFCHVRAQRLLGTFLCDVEPLPPLAPNSIRNFDLAAFERLKGFFKGRFIGQGMTENKLLPLAGYLVVQVVMGYKSIEYIGRRLIEPYLWEIALAAEQSPPLIYICSTTTPAPRMRTEMTSMSPLAPTTDC